MPLDPRLKIWQSISVAQLKQPHHHLPWTRNLPAVYSTLLFSAVKNKHEFIQWCKCHRFPTNICTLYWHLPLLFLWLWHHACWYFPPFQAYHTQETTDQFTFIFHGGLKKNKCCRTWEITALGEFKRRFKHNYFCYCDGGSGGSSSGGFVW